MILSHRHRFIFVKTRKTGGTSVELALSAICGPDDVITPVSRPDERLRKGLGPRNFLLPLGERCWYWPLLRLGRLNRPVAGLVRFSPHMGAGPIRAVIGPELFDTYETVTIERNPWDREVSNYHWIYRTPKASRPAFADYVRDPALNRRFDNVGRYSIDGRIVAGRVLRYERLAEDFATWMAALGIAAPPVPPHAKAGTRSAVDRDYRSHYNDETRAIIARRYRREIEAFGYEF